MLQAGTSQIKVLAHCKTYCTCHTNQEYSFPIPLTFYVAGAHSLNPIEFTRDRVGTLTNWQLSSTSIFVELPLSRLLHYTLY